MDILWMVLGGILLAAGLIGCFLPVVPGPPLAFVGLWIQHLKQVPVFTEKFLWIWFAIVATVTALDYIVPVYSAKKFGASKYGIWGCGIGLVAGIWLGPIGIIIGPLIGAFVGEIIANQDSGQALKAALGSFIGFLLGTMIKLVACLAMIWYWVMSMF